MMGGGLALFAAAWVADVGVTYGFQQPANAVALVPLVGPLVQCGERYGYRSQLPSTGSAIADRQIAAQVAQVNQTVQGITVAALVVDAALQLAGAALTIVGATTRRTGLTRFAASGQTVGARF
jgi:hypothetical protein